MPFISDAEATKLAKQVLPDDKYQDFVRVLDNMRHFDECLATSAPSPRCRLADPAENLKWCRLAFKVNQTAFEALLGEVLDRADFNEEG